MAFWGVKSGFLGVLKWLFSFQMAIRKIQKYLLLLEKLKNVARATFKIMLHKLHLHKIFFYKIFGRNSAIRLLEQ